MRKRVREEDEDIDEEDLSEFEEEESKPAPPKKVTKKAGVDRYVAFHSPEVAGIRDNQTGEPIAVDLWVALANVVSRLDRLEKGLL